MLRIGKFDNGRIISADELEIVLTDVDFYFLLDSYKIEEYEIEESYYSIYDYLPKQFIEFVLEKYVNKTKYKNVEGMEVEYAKEKNKFNALYGMSVTNMIKDNVIYKDELEEWFEEELTNEEIVEKLEIEKKKSKKSNKCESSYIQFIARSVRWSDTRTLIGYIQMKSKNI